MATREVTRCECGRRMSKYARFCKHCEAKRNEERLQKARQTVSSGVCPECGAPLRRNLALAGWWQCSQYGAETHRADPNSPSCSFQTFTE